MRFLISEHAAASTATLVLAGLMVACVGPAGDAGSAATETAGTPSDVDGTGMAGLRPFVDQAVADLAERLRVPSESVVVVSAEAVSWGDASLGCPQPDMRYAQVVTDGTRIVLEHDGDRHHYHSGGDEPPFLCQDPQEPVG